MPRPWRTNALSTPSRRIERALARIEAAAAQPAPRRRRADRPSWSALRDAHQALRAQVEGAIGQIDRLLETGERG